MKLHTYHTYHFSTYNFTVTLVMEQVSEKLNIDM